MLLKRSTIQLLRFPFSFFLMPVYWFALSWVQQIHTSHAILLFFIIHFLLYPSSNGYNSYMDRDTDSIGGVAKPLPPEKELYDMTIAMDLLALVLGSFISQHVALLLGCYIVCSRLYSYRGVRLKQYAVIGYLTVVLNQGALLFLLVYDGAASAPGTTPWAGMLAACFLIGGFYPITQVYQHRADEKDGVRTISMRLGIRGTFVFCAIMYLLAFGILFWHYYREEKLWLFYVLQLFFLPVLVYFFWWLMKVWNNASAADFKHTMQMNWLASTCTNLGFITILILNRLG